ncbi:hypothetical protein [Nannocystis pusilla]|uniref:hypothetical protein n=1 Tax=Nannocystis pusilla TaxID=889268 RepID=UPI003B7A750D
MLEDDASGRIRFVRRTGDVVALEEPILEVELSKIVAELTARARASSGGCSRRTTTSCSRARRCTSCGRFRRPCLRPMTALPPSRGAAALRRGAPARPRPRARRGSRGGADGRDGAAVRRLPARPDRDAGAARAGARPFLAEPGLRVVCGDVQADGTRWVQIDVGPDASPEQVLGALRTGTRLQDGDAASATLQLVRIAPPAAPLVLPGPRLRPGLTIFAGPPMPQPAVVGTSVAVRPISTLAMTADGTVALVSLLRFAPMLAEQIRVV